MNTIEQIIEDFEVVDDWDERYRYIIDLGRKLPELDQTLRTAEHKVRGCASQVWLVTTQSKNSLGQTILTFRGDSDAMIVRGLVAIVLILYSGKTVDEILALDAKSVFEKLGLDSHLSQQRSNGLASIVETIRAKAAVAKA